MLLNPLIIKTKAEIMKKYRIYMTPMVFVLAIIIVVPIGAGAVTLKIQTARLGLSWFAFGDTLSTMLKGNLLSETNIEVVPWGGGVVNPKFVSKDQSKTGLANLTTVVWAWNGYPVVYKSQKYTNIRALVGGLKSAWITAMAREAYIQKTGNDTLEKILLSGKPVRVVMKPAWSVVPAVADMVFKVMDTSRDQIVANGGKVIQVSAKKIPALIRDGRADLYFESVFMGQPVINETSLSANIRFLDMPDSVLTQLSREGLKTVPLPKWFKGQAGPTRALDMGTVLIANAKISEDLAYKITKTICENKMRLLASHNAWSTFQPEQAWKPENTGIPLHPGAARYYKEKGWIK
jgi:TRAP transporter TAXI family solute receptor